MHDPTSERIAELLDLWNDEIFIGGSLRDPGEYTSWDDLIECDEVMTFEEWEWCRENFRVDVDVEVWRKGGRRVRLDPIKLADSDLQFVFDAEDGWCSLQDPEATACGALSFNPDEARQVIRLLRLFLDRVAEEGGAE